MDFLEFRSEHALELDFILVRPRPAGLGADFEFLLEGVVVEVVAAPFRIQAVLKEE